MLTSEEIGRIVVMRGLGFSQGEIAKELGITQGAVSYNLRHLREKAGADGLERTYMRVMAAGWGFEKLREAGLIK
jgi:predicted transcriptional regulator